MHVSLVERHAIRYLEKNITVKPNLIKIIIIYAERYEKCSLASAY